MSLKNASSVSYCYDRHFLVFTYSTTYQRHISGNRRVKELNLSEPFRAHRNNLHSYHNCIRGKYSSRSETAMFEIAFATTLYNFMRTFYRLRQTFSQVYCRKLAQCVGLEPTRRTNARPDSNRLQYHYGNTAKIDKMHSIKGYQTHMDIFELSCLNCFCCTSYSQPVCCAFIL